LNGWILRTELEYLKTSSVTLLV